MDTNTKSKPVHTIREADVKAAIWLNGDEKAKFYSVTLSRVFTTEDHKPKDTYSFGLHDLTKVEVVLKHARTWIMDTRGE